MPVRRHTTGLTFMTTGPKLRLIILLICALFQTTVQAQGGLLESVFQLLAERHSYSADYVEMKHLSFLDVPLSHSGQLDFLPPDTMVRKQHSPKAQTFTITGQQLTIEAKGETKQMALDRVPGMQAFVVSMQAVLSGDIARLKNFYSVAISGGVDEWVLQLTPLDEQLRDYIETIHFAGQQGRVTRIKIYELGGDWSDMKLTPVSENNVG